MEIISFIGGALVGCILAIIILDLANKRQKVDGVIDVDSRNNLCQVHIISAELSNPKVKTAIFVVNHNADLSREEQSL